MSSSKIIGCGLLFAMCLISASMAQDELQDMQSPIDQEELLENVQELLRDIQSMLDPGNETVLEKENLACRCSGLKCQCCQNVRARRINFKKQCCLSITYLKRNKGFLTTLKCGSKTYFSKEVSVRNPPPVCVGIPVIKRGASICIQLNNVHRHGSSIHGCATFLARLFFIRVASVKLGCFDIYYGDEAAEPEIAMEPPSSYDASNWIAATQQDAEAAMPVFQDDVVMMENIGQPL